MANWSWAAAPGSYVFMYGSRRMLSVSSSGGIWNLTPEDERLTAGSPELHQHLSAIMYWLDRE